MDEHEYISILENAEKYHLLAQNISDVIWIYSIKHRKLLYVSPSIKNLTNISTEEAMQQTLGNSYTPETAKKARKILDSSLKEFLENPNEMKYYRFEVQQSIKIRTLKWIENIIHYQFAQNGDIEMVGVSRDIDRRKKAELELQQYKEHLEELVKQRTEELEIAQKERIQALIKGEENERTRISQELHDGLGPLLSSLKMLMQGIERMNDPQKIKEFVGTAQPVFSEILQSVTEISNNLIPYMLRKFGLFSGLKNFIEKVAGFTNIQYNYHFEINERLEEIYEITLYRVITELINNSIKHSKATEINLNINKIDDKIYIRFDDNGIGFDFDKSISKGKGLGLLNMQNRIENINGKITFVSKVNEGIGVEISVPYCIKLIEYE